LKCEYLEYCISSQGISIDANSTQTMIGSTLTGIKSGGEDGVKIKRGSFDSRKIRGRRFVKKRDLCGTGRGGEDPRTEDRQPLATNTVL